MTTKIKILIAILCLIACASCRVISEGPRYRLNKVAAVSKLSAQQNCQNETDPGIQQKSIMADSSNAVLNTCQADSSGNAVAQTRSVTKPHNNTSSSFKITKTPSLRLRTKIINSSGMANTAEKRGILNILAIAGIFIAIGFIFGIKAALIAFAIGALFCLIAIGLLLLLLKSFLSAG